jgi:PAS domain S-box-containing protein
MKKDSISTSQECFRLYKTGARTKRSYWDLLSFFPDPVLVLNLDGIVAYLNPAFEKVFGWRLAELKGGHIPFIPEHLKKEALQEFKRLLRKHTIYGVEAPRLTKDKRLLYTEMSSSIFFGDNDEPEGQVIILRDVTLERRIARSNQALFRIARALPRFKRLDDRLAFITREVQELIGVEGASVILLDEEKKTFFIRTAIYDDTEVGRKMCELRFPSDKGVAGLVYRTQAPLIVHDTSKSPFFFRKVDEQMGYRTRNMLDVPIRTQDRKIGVLCAVNKKIGKFDHTDVELLSAIASTVALPIENARINDELDHSYRKVRSLNRAKERVIHQLSHELKTPVAVLAASLQLLARRLSTHDDRSVTRIFDRAQRNIDRILAMQYRIEDIQRERDYTSRQAMSAILEACSDLLETLVSAETGQEDAALRIRQRVQKIFAPSDESPVFIRLDRFVEATIQSMRPRFSHRQIELTTDLVAVGAVLIPESVLAIIVEGLLRNAIENTPDGGCVKITVRQDNQHTLMEVKDFGVGITTQNQPLIFEHNFSTRDIMQYASGQAYDFNAGGKGFDLLRMKIFSERYRFDLHMESTRCRHIPNDENLCPGKIELCKHCSCPKDCLASGGTTVFVRFDPAKGEKK